MLRLVRLEEAQLLKIHKRSVFNVSQGAKLVLRQILVQNVCLGFSITKITAYYSVQAISLDPVRPVLPVRRNVERDVKVPPNAKVATMVW